MGKLSLKIVVANADYVQVLLFSIDLDVEWVVGFQKGIGLVSELTECRVGNTSLMLVVLNLVTNSLLKCMKNSFEQSLLIEKLSSPDVERLTGIQLLEELWSPGHLIAIVDFSVLQSNSVNHGVTIKSMMAVVLWEELRIWTISKVDAVDVGWNLASYDVNHLIRVLVVNRSKVTLEEWVVAWSNPKFTVKIFLDWRKQEPQTELIQRVQY